MSLSAEDRSEQEIGPLLMSGSFNPNSLIYTYGRFFETLGRSIFRHFGAYEAGLSGVNLLDRALLRALPELMFANASARLLQLANQHKPSIILIFKGMDIKSKTLCRLKDRGFKLVCYNADHPYDFTHRGTGNRNVQESVPFYDLYITYSKRIQAEIAEKNPTVHTAIVPFGHSVSEEDFARIENTPEVERICFAGTADSSRAMSIKNLAKTGLPIDVFGPGWEKFCNHEKNVRVMGSVYGMALNRILRSYKVQLNLFRSHNEGSHNMRSFEIPACGGIMLAPRSAEHESFFASGQEAFFYSDHESMITMARYLLSLDEQKANKVRRRARLRCVESGYSYESRSRAFSSLLDSVVLQ